MSKERSTVKEQDWPTGAVTFLFADMENSALLWERHQAAMRSAVADHDIILGTAVTSHGGLIVKNTGDGALAAFSSPSAALLAAIAGQRALGDAAWPTVAPDRIRVRMGIHTGEAELRGNDYFGNAVNRAARLMSLGHGGQILVSGTTIRLLEETLPAGVSLIDLGEYQLKGLAVPAQVFQAYTADLVHTFPPLRVAENARGNLPQALTTFVGRERELAEIDQLMKEVRLLTLTGAGGMGKTQLALEWARRHTRTTGNGNLRYADGIFFIDLAPVKNLDQVAPAIAEVFGFPLQGERRPPEQQIIDYLRQKDLLLILDNFEHIIDASVFVNEILQIASRVQILVTSRERLNLSSEQVYPIGGLTYPVSVQDRPYDMGDLQSYSAVQLFLSSARSVHPGFKLRPEDRQSVVRICRTTSGMPLAIKLASAWAAFLPLTTLADEIETHLDLLATELRDLPARHRSIRATVDTTLKYLQPREQDIFALLSIFRGGFTWEAAAAIVQQQRNDPELRRILSTLSNKSLLSYDEDAQRFTVHELLRQYGAEQLNSPRVLQEVASVQQRHALYFAQLLEVCQSGLEGTQYDESLRLIEADLQNVLIAWDWLVENEHYLELSKAIDSLGLFHESQGYLPTGRRNFSLLAARWRQRLAGNAQVPAYNEARDRHLLAKTLAWQSVFELDRQKAESLLLEGLRLLDDPVSDPVTGRSERAFICYRLGQLLYDSQMARAIGFLDEGLGLYQELNDLWGIAYCLQCLGSTYLFVNMETSRRYLLQAVEVFEESGDIRGLSEALYWLTGVVAYQGDDELMEELHDRFLALISGHEQPLVLERALGTKATVNDVKGQYFLAARYREELIALLEDLGRNTSMEKIYLATMYLHAGQFEKGRTLLEQARHNFELAAVENDHQLAFCHHILAMLALAEDQFHKAQEYLLRGAIPVYLLNDDEVDLAGAHAFSAIAHICLQEIDMARPRLIAGLKLALDHRGFFALGENLLGVALMWAHEGRLARARQIYDLVRDRPKFGKSILYEAIAGRKIRVLTASVSAKEASAPIQGSAQNDIWEEAVSVLDELAEPCQDTNHERHRA